MSVLITNPTPQQTFQKDDKKVSAHRDMIASPAFERASEVAMLEYTRLVTMKIQDANGSAAAGMKIQGALEFLQTFRMLAETPTPRQPKPQESLDYRR